MCRRLALGLAIAAAPLWASPAEARQTEADAAQTIEALRARIDELRPIRDAAEAALREREARDEASARIAAARAARVDTLRVGLVNIVTPVDQVELARELFSGVWTRHYANIVHSATLAESHVSFQWSDQLVPIHLEGTPRRFEFSRWARRPGVVRAIRDGIGAAVNYDLSRHNTKIGRWVDGNPLRTHDLEQVYRAVALTESRATRGCLAGDLDGCRSALGLGTTLDQAQLESWYTPEERRALAARSYFHRIRQTQEAGLECVEGRVIVSCDRLLLGAEGIYRRDWAPLAGPARETLLAYAIERGGPGAWDRLVAEPSMEPIDALEHASGASLHELLEGWRARLLEHRPETFANLVPKSGLTLVWTLFFAALAMRSTRWRFG